MENIVIKPEIVRTKTKRIRNNIIASLSKYNNNKAKSLKNYIKDSKGKTVVGLKNQIDKEAMLIDGMGEILVEILDYIDAACDDFERLDKKYANNKLS